MPRQCQRVIDGCTATELRESSRCGNPIAAGLSCSRMSRAYTDAVRLALGLFSIAAITFVYVKWLHVSNATTVSMTFLMVVLVIAATSRLCVAIVTSIVASPGFQFLLPAAGRHAHDRGSAQLGGVVRVSRGQPRRQQLVGGGPGPHSGGAGAPRRAGATIRFEPRHPRGHREPRGHHDPRALARQAIRP